MKTRARKGGASKKAETETVPSTVQQLDPSVQNPPQVFIWPKDTSRDARVITLPNPATSAPNRYLLCPEKGCFEFTRIAGPKRTCRSWLLAPERKENRDGQDGSQENDEGYVLQMPDLMVATPIDPLFLVLPGLAEDEARDKQMFLTTLDYLERLEERSGHLKQMLRQDEAGRLEKKLEASILSVCDTMEAGDEMLCKLSRGKVLGRLVAKAGRMVEQGLPASMEERFVKQALAVPVMNIRREESNVSAAEGENASADAESESTSTSQDTQASDTTALSSTTAATSVPPTPTPPPSAATPETARLLRLRTALNFLLTSYIPPSLRSTLQSRISDPSTSTLDFTPLDAHLAHLAKLKFEAQALRSISDNISRKRSAMDEEALERAEAKKRKKEEEEVRKKSQSVGVKKLAKADRSGMKSISSFFGGKPAAGGKK